jgi:nicotinamidase-related amidase
MMASKRSKAVSLHPDHTALLLIDLITDFEFDDGDKLLKAALPAAKSISALKKKAKSAGVPVVYVNDNWGKWKEDFKTIVRHFTKPSAKGAEVVSLLKPDPDDFYILKPHRSAFYSTSLMLLLKNLGVKKLIITGVTTDICVIFSANDAYMRGFELHVPDDCVAAVTKEHHQTAMSLIERVLKADTSPSSLISFASS